MCCRAIFQILDLESFKRDLERQVNELKAKCEQIEKRAAEQRQVEEKKHQDEIQFLKRNNQQLKVNHKKNPCDQMFCRFRYYDFYYALI